MNRRFLKLCCGRKSAFFKRNQSTIAFPRRPAHSASAYAAISKIIALQAIFAFMSFGLKNLLFLCSYALMFFCSVEN